MRPALLVLAAALPGVPQEGEKAMRISACRTKVGRTRLSTIRPATLIDLCGRAGLKDAAAEVEASLTAILDQAR
jgi:hypothetical protein